MFLAVAAPPLIATPAGAKAAAAEAAAADTPIGGTLAEVHARHDAENRRRGRRGGIAQPADPAVEPAPTPLHRGRQDRRGARGVHAGSQRKGVAKGAPMCFFSSQFL